MRHMRQYGETGVGMILLLLGVLALPACVGSTPTPDPNNGVSSASYRLAVDRADKNLSSVLVRLDMLRVDDLSSAHPRHAKEWWDAQLVLIETTKDLLDATLQGSKYAGSTARTPAAVTATAGGGQ